MEYTDLKEEAFVDKLKEIIDKVSKQYLASAGEPMHYQSTKRDMWSEGIVDSVLKDLAALTSMQAHGENNSPEAEELVRTKFVGALARAIAPRTGAHLAECHAAGRQSHACCNRTTAPGWSLHVARGPTTRKTSSSRTHPTSASTSAAWSRSSPSLPERHSALGWWPAGRASNRKTPCGMYAISSDLCAGRRRREVSGRPGSVGVRAAAPPAAKE